MSDLADQIAADAKALIDSDGDAITYHQYVSEGVYTDLDINCIPTMGELTPNPADARRTLRHDLVLAVAKLDVAAVQINADEVTIPGEWVDKTSDQRLRVSRVIERFDKGKWLVGVG